ncbi:MAG TPA: hypothetical protein VGB10_02980 [Bacteroidota bacterium]
MKKLLTILAVGAVGTFFVVRNLMQRNNALHFTEAEDVSAKNFGAFPVEIPEEQFDALFV